MNFLEKKKPTANACGGGGYRRDRALPVHEMWTSVSGHRALGPAAQHHFSGHGHRRFPAVPSENLDESELHISNWKATNSDVGGPLGVV